MRVLCYRCGRPIVRLDPYGEGCKCTPPDVTPPRPQHARDKFWYSPPRGKWPKKSI